ncbi:hypothetical protein KC19_VG040800 [Ceratodon purpureus]|uniref:Uncharacterized protein n=1 Tax=Ceratodon purpureus TaxID=3225 RepID=A0A8T0HM92_CERPU|nr:hypothetical protein KC19_VG040800 [Ceratodon purpureus]
MNSVGIAIATRRWCSSATHPVSTLLTILTMSTQFGTVKEVAAHIQHWSKGASKEEVTEIRHYGDILRSTRPTTTLLLARSQVSFPRALPVTNSREITLSPCIVVGNACFF